MCKLYIAQSVMVEQLCGYFNRKLFFRVALDRVQRNIRAWLALRNWSWWRMYTRVKPLLSIARQEDEMRQAAEELEKTKEEMEKLTDIKKQLEERNAMMERELQDLKANSGSIEETLSEAQEQGRWTYEGQIWHGSFDQGEEIPKLYTVKYVQYTYSNISYWTR